MKYKGVEIGIPTIGQIADFIFEKNMTISASEVYDYYEKRNWLTKKGRPIYSLEAMVNAMNGVHCMPKRNMTKDEKKSFKEEKIRRKRERRQKRAKEQQEKHSKREKIIGARIDMPYNEQLKTRRWFIFREKVFKHNGRVCKMCGSKTYLQVHHLKYKAKHYAWEYDLDEVVVICRKCHEKVHGINKTKF